MTSRADMEYVQTSIDKSRPLSDYWMRVTQERGVTGAVAQAYELLNITDPDRLFTDSAMADVRELLRCIHAVLAP
jgi:hypothetical protein